MMCLWGRPVPPGMLAMLTCTKPSCTIIVRWTFLKGKDAGWLFYNKSNRKRKIKQVNSERLRKPLSRGVRGGGGAVAD